MYCIHKRDARDGLDTSDVPPIRRPSIGIISGRHGSLVVANGIFAGGTLSPAAAAAAATTNGKCHDNAGFVADTITTESNNGNNGLTPNAALSIVKEMPALHLERCKL